MMKNKTHAIGWKVSDFALPGIDGKTYSLAEVRGPKGTLVVFLCNHCPYVKASINRMFVAGDDAANRSSVVELVAALGFEVVDAGPLRNVRLLEAHCMLWIDLAFTCGLGRDFAFAVVRR